MVVDAVERGPAGAGEKAADGLVGQQHELLDEGVRARLVVPARRDDPPVRDLERELTRAQVERTAGVAAGAQLARERIGAREQLAARMAAIAGEHLVRLVIGQPRAAADERAPDARRPGPAVGPDPQLDADDAPHLAGAQAARSGRELERQHRLDRSGHVHAAGAAARLAVERSSRLHVARDVGDVHPRAHAVAVGLDADRIVEVARGRGVDRDRVELEQVVPALLRLALARGPARLTQGLVGPRARQPALQQQRTQDVARCRRESPAARRRARCLPRASTTTSSPASTARPERRPSASCWPSSKNGCATRKRPRRSTVQATSGGPPSSSVTASWRWRPRARAAASAPATSGRMP